MACTAFNHKLMAVAMRSLSRWPAPGIASAPSRRVTGCAGGPGEAAPATGRRSHRRSAPRGGCSSCGRGRASREDQRDVASHRRRRPLGLVRDRGGPLLAKLSSASAKAGKGEVLGRHRHARDFASQALMSLAVSGLIGGSDRETGGCRETAASVRWRRGAADRKLLVDALASLAAERQVIVERVRRTWRLSRVAAPRPLSSPAYIS